MICEICERAFSKSSGHGGQNRKICFSCMPDGLTKGERDKRRYHLYSIKNANIKMKNGCNKCGYNNCPDALEWHHVGNKEEHPANAMKKSWRAFMKEVDECILLCSNCHREEHYK